MLVLLDFSVSFPVEIIKQYNYDGVLNDNDRCNGERYLAFRRNQWNHKQQPNDPELELKERAVK
jgi:hypothetical protein